MVDFKLKFLQENFEILGILSTNKLQEIIKRWDYII